MLSQCPKLHPRCLSIVNTDQGYGLAPNVLSRMKLHPREQGLDGADSSVKWGGSSPARARACH